MLPNLTTTTTHQAAIYLHASPKHHNHFPFSLTIRQLRDVQTRGGLGGSSRSPARWLTVERPD